MSDMFDSTPELIGRDATLLHTVDIAGVGLSHIVTNTDIGTLPVWVWLQRDGSPDVYLVAGERIASGSAIDTMGVKKVPLEVGDKIMGRSLRANSLTSLVAAYKDT